MMGSYYNTIAADATGAMLNAGTTYIFKMNAETAADLTTTYSFKYWPQGTSEPAGWMMQGIEGGNKPQTGAVALVAHQLDAEFGDITVEQLP